MTTPFPTPAGQNRRGLRLVFALDRGASPVGDPKCPDLEWELSDPAVVADTSLAPGVETIEFRAWVPTSAAGRKFWLQAAERSRPDLSACRLSQPTSVIFAAD